MLLLKIQMIVDRNVHFHSCPTMFLYASKRNQLGDTLHRHIYKKQLVHLFQKRSGCWTGLFLAGRCWTGDHSGVQHQAVRNCWVNWQGANFSVVNWSLSQMSAKRTIFPPGTPSRFKQSKQANNQTRHKPPTTRMHPRNLSHRVSKIVY